MESGLPVQMVIRGFSVVNRVAFNNNESNTYRPFPNQISFDQSLRSEHGRLRRVGELSSFNVGTIYHELFHGYFHQVLRKDRPPLFYRFHRQVARLYPHLNRAQAENAHEEAWGLMIGHLVSEYIYFKRQIDRLIESEDDPNDIEAGILKLKGLWERSMKVRPSGYYSTVGTVGGYWSDVAAGLETLVSDGWRAFRNHQNQEKLMDTEVPITDEDVRLIERHLLELKIVEDFYNTFPALTRFVRDSDEASER